LKPIEESFSEMYASKYKMSAEQCIKEIFEGDEAAFNAEVNWYISEGCGVPG
jgi:hypothetical protein